MSEIYSISKVFIVISLTFLPGCDIQAQENADTTAVGQIDYITFEYSENGAMVLQEPGIDQKDDEITGNDVNLRKTYHISLEKDPATGLPTNIVHIDTRNLSGRKNCHFAVHTISGAEVMSGKVNNQRKQYDLSKLPSGIYLLTLTINKKKETLKFIRR